MKRWARAVWLAAWSLVVQVAMLVDHACNVALGVKAVFLAAVTSEEQEPCYASETLSAHAARASKARKPWGSFMRPIIDWLYSWQPSDPRVDKAVGRVVTDHCDRAFEKTRLGLYLPREYRDQSINA